MTQFYAYLWLREDGTPYYVGKGHGQRAYRHQKPPYPPKEKSRILILNRATEAEASKTEIELIRNWGREDIGTGCLHNRTDGGEGKTGRIVSLETHRRMSEAQKGNKKALGHKNHLGYRHTTEWKAQMSAANTGQVSNRLGMRATEETKEKQRAAMLVYWRKQGPKTHCPNGHPMSDDNCIACLLKQGHRKCRICANARVRRYHLRQKEKKS